MPAIRISDLFVLLQIVILTLGIKTVSSSSVAGYTSVLCPHIQSPSIINSMFLFQLTVSLNDR